ncbi:KdsC family phosphatase [Sporomusa acidovorans]|uniref:3-deoxy-D-manno-octulosonate 8-phosphate phosphatase KdsC n=1 Tax=Sporomusa acidovorans (strain ATCC 49682 / DSM 3132 / Mol) TaxID=1123286 RepID=A0ABZ3J7P1_SPOA4|nr:HAD hydrolase family protein [Sporomusa acidovorans]OZC19305.1 3-deoxy-D-manno-octulosonate 8-phosphate phosphatase KdsC [Sporomusa acidovorans DSM 3132]SDD81244.1 3-deoxy-D-manno-octulosonate 8-phosphate phosphatase (KDO 8-P phosphatase) [Sporomusa acidovorans]
MESVRYAEPIRLIIFDVDGVLTDGHIIFGQDGEALKAFHCQDGMGISLAHKAGLRTAIITGRESQIVYKRATELKIGDIHQAAADKVAALRALMEKYSLTLEQIAYIGDDINDLPVMVQVGLPCAVANAVPEVKAAAKFISARPGGNGAVRDSIEFILKAQKIWERLVAEYTISDRFAITQ